MAGRSGAPLGGARLSLLLAPALAAAFVLASAAPAHAHGGNYQPPPPPPPENPPAKPEPGPTEVGGGGPPDGGGGDPGGGPVTGGGEPGGEPTPSGGGPTTGGGPPSGGGPTTGSGKRSSSGLSPDHWTRWWYANRITLIDFDARVLANAPATPGGTDGAGAAALERAELSLLLARATADDSADIAGSAAIALGRNGDLGDAPTLALVLRDRKRAHEVREGASLGLGLLPANELPASRAASAALREAAASDKEPSRLRAIAAWSLGLRRDAGAVPFLRELADDERAGWDVRAAAVSALGLSGCADVRQDLEHWLTADGRAGEATILRVHAAHGLARLGDAASIPALRSVLKEDDEDVRRAAILALGCLTPLGDTDTIERLVHVLERDKDRACRNMAALSLGRIGDLKAAKALRYAYEKGEGLHQPFAAIGLGLLARKAGEPALLGSIRYALKERADPDLRGALCVALAIGGDQASAKTLREVLTDRGSMSVRPHAAFACGMLGDQASAPILRAMLDEQKDPDFQREASLGLGMLGDVEAQKQLAARISESTSLYVQGAAACALGRMGGTSSLRALRTLAEDGSRPDLARAFGVVGLGFVLDRSQGRGLARISADLDWYLQSPSVTEILTIL